MATTAGLDKTAGFDNTAGFDKKAISDQRACVSDKVEAVAESTSSLTMTGRGSTGPKVQAAVTCVSE